MESRELHFTQEKAMSVERDAVLKRYERVLRNRALDAATPTSTPPATPKQIEMKARAAKNIDAYLNQNAAGRWQLSQPIDDADLRSRVIDGMVVSEGAPVIGVLLDGPDPATGLAPVLVTLR